MAKLLHKREEIRDWVLARAGAPMLEAFPDGTREQVLLQLTFGQHMLNADGNEGPDLLAGFQLVSWDDWFAEFDKQGLALKVNDEVPGRLDHAYEFVARSGHGLTTEAARQPPL
ncbi:MAG: hypothetical protein P4M09_09050 [Devosia sp.]|nr:hypothetical protein [Devosia sp.]